MKDLRCAVGLHHWQHHVNREMGGPNAGYDLCTRCHREKKQYDGRGNPSFKGPLIG